MNELQEKVEKVIKGLYCCSQMSGEVCNECPYANECKDGEGLLAGSAHLAANALDLLRAQDCIAHIARGHYYLNAREEWYCQPRECGICGCRWMTERDHQDHYCPNCGSEVSIYDGGKCLSD